MKKDIVKSFRTTSEGEEQLNNIMNLFELNQSDTINQLIEKAIKGESVSVELEICPLRVNLENGYFCAQKPVKPQKLGNGSLKDANALCEKCQYFKKLMIEFEQLKEEYELLKEEPWRKEIPYCAPGEEPWKTKAPYCSHTESENHIEDNSLLEKLFSLSVTQNNTNVKGRYSCPLMPKQEWLERGRKAMSVQECLVKNKDNKCRYLKWFEIGSEEIKNMVTEWLQIRGYRNV